MLENVDTLAYFWLQNINKKFAKKCGFSFWKSKEGHQVQENKVPCLRIYEECFDKILEKINPNSLQNNWKSLAGE